MKPTLTLSDQAKDASGTIRQGVRIRAKLDLKGGTARKVKVTYSETSPDKKKNKTLNETFTRPKSNRWAITSQSEIQQKSLQKV